MKALVLGAGGFLGSRLAYRLTKAGWTVVGIVRDTDAPHVGQRLGEVRADVDLHRGDATNPELLDRLIHGVDAVFPFAGASGAAHSMRSPLEDAAENVLGHLSLLEALRARNPGARVVFPGSRLQYGRVTTIPVAEDHPQRPTSLYGLHKLVGEEYHRLYHEVHGVKASCLRISNPYGPFQNRADREFGVVGTFIALAMAGEAIPVYGGGGQLRDYVFVDDVIDACIAAATNVAAVGQVFNVGGSRATTIREMAETVVSVVGSGTVVDREWPELEQAIETGDYLGDISRVRSVLGWEPTTSLHDGLTQTVAAGLSAR